MEGHLSNMTLTFYINGKGQRLQNFQDKMVDYKTEGMIKNTSMRFNFWFCALCHLS